MTLWTWIHLAHLALLSSGIRSHPSEARSNLITAIPHHASQRTPQSEYVSTDLQTSVFRCFEITRTDCSTGFTSALNSIPKGTWKILITDDHSQALLDTVYKNFDILQQNVTCKCRINRSCDSLQITACICQDGVTRTVGHPESSSTCTHPAGLRADVSAVEPLHSPRQPMGVDAIYLLTPTSQNVDRVIADFSQGRRTYKAAHLFFIDGESTEARMQVEPQQNSSA